MTKSLRVSYCVSNFLHQVMVSCLIALTVFMEKSLILVTLSYKLTVAFSGEGAKLIMRYNFVTELISTLKVFVM